VVEQINHPCLGRWCFEHHLATGLENGKIAEKLVIGVSTVKTHIQNILKKLQFHDREQAAVYFVMKNSSRSENARKDEE